MDFFAVFVVLYFLAFLAYALYWRRRLMPLPHERYNGFHVYAVEGTKRWHVEKDLLRLYKPIKSPTITPIQAPDPQHEEIPAWLLFRYLFPLLKPFLK